MTPPRSHYRLTPKGQAVVDAMIKAEAPAIRAEILKAVQHPNNGTISGIDARERGAMAAVDYILENFSIQRKSKKCASNNASNTLSL